MDRLGKIVREAREKRNETYARMAKAIKCSEAFARHIEMSKSVPISPRLIEGLIKHYRLKRGPTESAAKIRTKVGKAYFKKWRAKNA